MTGRNSHRRRGAVQLIMASSFGGTLATSIFEIRSSYDFHGRPGSYRPNTIPPAEFLGANGVGGRKRGVMATVRTVNRKPNRSAVVATFTYAGVMAAGLSQCQSVHGAVQRFAVPCPVVAIELPDTVQTLGATLQAYRRAGGEAFCPGFKDYRLNNHLGSFSVRWNRAATCRVDVGYTYITPAKDDSEDTQRFEAMQDSLAHLVAELIVRSPVSPSTAARQSFNGRDQIRSWCEQTKR